jgi:amidase
MTNLCDLSAREAIRGVQTGAFTVQALARAHLNHIGEIDPAIRAWQYLDPDQVMAGAAALDRQGDAPLRGLTLGVKDVICTSDMPTTFGSAAYSGYTPPYDATCVTMSRASGALVLGKTVSTEFAFVSPGPTRNPANLLHTPGGSSSGSAAAVAAKMVQVALATQTGGSTIRPAAFCGIVGYKPTFDLIETTGVKTLARGLDTVGVMARNVRDAALFTAIITARKDLIVGDEPYRPKVGIYRTEAWHLARPETEQALNQAARALARAGCAVSETNLMPGFDRLLDLHYRLFEWGLWLGLSHERLTLSDRIAAETRDMLERMGPATEEDHVPTTSAKIYDAALAKAEHARGNLEALFGDNDILLTPATPGEAPEGIASTGDASFNSLWTMLHVPCITVPVAKGPKGLPVGIQMVGRRGDDARLLRAAAAVEAAIAIS